MRQTEKNDASPRCSSGIIPCLEGNGIMLLHICCAPDACWPISYLKGLGWDVTGFFYGNNIHPREEYQKRLESIGLLASFEKTHILCPDYTPQKWMSQCGAMSSYPEGGERCAACFRLQLLETLKMAMAMGFHYIATTLTISPHKNIALINDIGREICADTCVTYIPTEFRKHGGFQESVKRSKELGLYRQRYCGCIFSAGKGDERMITGKLPPDLLEIAILSQSGAKNENVLLGPALGEDASVIRWREGKLLVASSDPILGADVDAGRYLVQVNANDIAAKGGDPLYLLATLIVPASQGVERCRRLMTEIDEECRSIGVSVIGGHTELSDRIDKPILCGAMIGEAEKLLRARDIEMGSLVIMTKHAGIEGMSILVHSQQKELKAFITEEEFFTADAFSDELSVIPEARILRKYASFMHDPTEGGIAGGLLESTKAAELGVKLYPDAVPVHPVTKKASLGLGFDPLRLISSGVLLAFVRRESSQSALNELALAGIQASIIGEVVEIGEGNIDESFNEELWRFV